MKQNETLFGIKWHYDWIYVVSLIESKTGEFEQI